MNNNYKIIPSTDKEILEVAKSLCFPDFDYDVLSSEPLDSKGIKDDELDVVESHAQLVKFDLGEEEVTYLMWRIDPRYWNKLIISGGEEFLARSLIWKYGRIAWRAGGGWPLYQVPCPRSDGKHSIHINFGQKLFAPCSSLSSGKGVHMTNVIARVSDDKYDDNSGYFELIVTGYSRD